MFDVLVQACVCEWRDFISLLISSSLSLYAHLKQVTLRFCPDSLADYDDEFAVDTAESRFTVPVWARRPPPSLTLPHDLRVGDVLVGNRRVRGTN